MDFLLDELDLYLCLKITPKNPEPFAQSFGGCRVFRDKLLNVTLVKWLELNYKTSLKPIRKL